MMKRSVLILALLLTGFSSAFADDGWVLSAEGECDDYTGAAAANGTIGVLHWKEPFSVRQIVLNNVFELSRKTKVNCPVLGLNPFTIYMTVDGKRVTDWSDWRQCIDMKNAEHSTAFTAGGKVAVSYSLIALRNLPHVALFKVKVKALQDASVCFSKTITVPEGYRDPVYSNGEFFADGTKIRMQQTSATTERGRHDVSAASMFIYDQSEGTYDVSGERGMLKYELSAGEEAEFSVVGSVCTTAEYSDPYSEAQRLLVYVDCLGTDKVIAGHRRMWERMWESDIIIEGDLRAQQLVRFALYNLYSSCREGTGCSIPPMGLSSLGYNGHIFWDTEIWMYPPMLLMNQGIARSMVDYRADRIDAARRKAGDYGYAGLMFPWESDSDGQEATPVWALTGPLEHHVSADVGIAAWNYYRVTKDVSWLRDEGWELLKGVADFLVSRAEENPDGTFSISGVVGADEYAQNVTDNAFTNASAKVALRNALKAAKVCGYKAPDAWKKTADGLRIHVSPEGVTLEYDGYAGQMIKQADVNLLAYPLDVVTDHDRIRKDLDYYDDKVDMVDGPAMTFSIFAIQYARLGDREKAMSMFRRAYEPNIRPPFGVFAETPASNNPYFMTGAGGMLQAVLFGFGGLNITDDGIIQKNPMLPSGWRSLTMTGVGPEKKTFKVNQ